MLRVWRHEIMRNHGSPLRPSRHRLGLRILSVALCLSLVSGAIGLFEPIEWMLRAADTRETALGLSAGVSRQMLFRIADAYEDMASYVVAKAPRQQQND